MTKRILGVMLATVLVAAPAFAADYPFVVTNKTDSDIISINVRGGQVVGFKKVVQGGERSFTLSLPDGTCTARIQINLNDADAILFDSYDACNSGGLDVFY